MPPRAEACAYSPPHIPFYGANADGASAGTVVPSTVAQGGKATVTITGVTSGGWVTVSITAGSEAKGSFAVGGAQTLVCKDNTNAAEVSANPCDSNPAGGEVGVIVNVASDSPNGPIVVLAAGLDGTPEADYTVISVTNALTPASLSVKATDDAIAVDTDTSTPAIEAGTTPLTVTVKNATGGGVATTVHLRTSLGLISCSSGGDLVQACSVDTVIGNGATAGQPTATVTLHAAAVSGEATVTASIPAHGLTATDTVTIYGAASKISVKSDQGAIEIGGSTFIVVTVTDDGGNAVANKKFSGATDATAAGPSKDATKLILSHTATKPAPPGAPIPTCFENVNTTDPDGGTNGKGQCVIKVFAPKKGSDPDGDEITGDKRRCRQQPCEHGDCGRNAWCSHRDGCVVRHDQGVCHDQRRRAAEQHHQRRPRTSGHAERDQDHGHGLGRR